MENINFIIFDNNIDMISVNKKGSHLMTALIEISM